MTGTLYGIGVGPGDPELMTLRAHRLVSAARVVAYPAPDSGQSLARSIAAAAIPPHAEEIPIRIPMRRDRDPAQEAYAAGARRIARHLESGSDVMVLCEGDPLFYGSFMYLLARLADRFPVEIVPGVTSLTACAALLKQPLTARNDVLTVLPAPLPDIELRPRIEGSQAVAILKAGRHLARLRALIDSMGLLGRAGYVERATLPEARALPLAEAPETGPYFSMIMISKGDDPWLSQRLS